MPETLRSTTPAYQPSGPAPLPPGPSAAEESSAPDDLKSRLLRLALLPLGAAVVIGAGVAVFLTQAPDSSPSWMAPVVLGSAAVLMALAAYLAAGSASKTDAQLNRRILAVRRSTVETHYKVWQVLDDLQRNLPAEQRWSVPLPNPGASAPTTDEALRLLAAEARHLRAAAEAVAARGVRPAAPKAAPAAPVAPMITSGPIDAVNVNSRVGIFVNLARRLQSLVHREIEQLDELENQVEDPDLLKGLFSVDHLATRIRRHAENLAVLGGATSHRQWSRPVNVYEALRSAVAEVEQYARVKLVRPIDGTLKGHAVADIIHLVAELVENATTFSAPNTQVLIRVARVRTGLAVEVEDRGLGMEPHERARFNKMLMTPDQVDLDELLADGRIGLYVVSSLAHRHELTVQLQSNIFGGTQAILVVPEDLLGDDTPAPKPPVQREIPAAPQQMPVRQPGALTPPQLPSMQLRPLPTAGTGHYNAPAPQPRMDSAAYTPSYAAPANGAPSVDTGALPVTAELQVVTDYPEDRMNGSGGAHAYDPDGRPALPKRNKQTHLAPQLRDAPQQGARGAEPGHDPGLMRAFQQGRQRADGGPQIPTSDGSVSPYRNEEF
ncbi:sensor histidine kinase [Glycomyces harbinensis]|uniref:histidine kinase n=1 Tax=Glycomyces harbinensis TaxID=58114 RepID=A0A1G6ZBN5_9ACTN|nr:ATP-binding protein [Glycomyces harbinensis]SDD99146.1 Histidine kinase-, DNA gyrase B-, and HSP90-like ATPase [Glycomyces harbinensis]